MNPMESQNVNRRAGERLQPWAITGLTLVAVGSLVHLVPKKEIDPELKEASLLPYCQDISTELMSDHEGVIVGGLPIDAFNDEDSTVDVEKCSIKVNDNFKSLLLRKNGTVRDYDILLFDRDGKGKPKRLSDDEQKVLKANIDNATKNRASSLNQPAPEISIFSFDNHSSLVHSATIVSDEGEVFLEQGFVRQSLPENAMDVWSLVLSDGTTVNILNPWEQYWRSMIRFSSGMKTKDAEKLGSMLSRLRNTKGLDEMEQGGLCQAYQSFHDRMLEQNSFSTVLEAMQLADRDWNRLLGLGKFALASNAMSLGQKFKFVERVVQGTPRFFNRFVGSK